MSLENNICSHKKVMDLLEQDRSTEALRTAGPLLEDDPENVLAWYLTARCFAYLGDESTFLKNLKNIASAFAHAGFPVSAIACAKEYELHKQNPRMLYKTIARLYSKDSSRIVEKQPVPPSIPMGRLLPWGDELTDDQVKSRAIDLMAVAWGDAMTRQAGHHDLPLMPLLSALSEPGFLRLVECFTFEQVAAGETLIRQGDCGAEFFVIASGTVNVEKTTGAAKPIQLAQLGPGAFVGEMAMVSSSPRAAGVVASTRLQVLKADKQHLETLATEVPEVADVLVGFCHARMLENLIRMSPVLSPVPVSSRPDLIAMFDTDYYPEGETIIEEGTPGQGLFLIVSGTVAVIKIVDGEPARVAALGSGDLFGEISLLMQKDATASVVAMENTAVLTLERERFHAVTDAFPQLLKGAYDIALEREKRNCSIVGQAVQADDNIVLV